MWKIRFLLLTVAVLQCAMPTSGISQEPEDPGHVVATVNGKEITLADVDRKTGVRLHDLQMSIFRLRKTTLDYLILEVLMEEEARSLGLTLEEYKKRLSSESEISQADVDFIVRKLYPPEMVENPEYRQRVRVQLERAKKAELLRGKERKLREGAQVDVYLQPPPLPTVQAEVHDRDGFGPRDAPVTIVEFADFQCAHCRATAPIIRDTLGRYGERVRYIYRHFPLPHHGYAFAAAEASECARAEGKFWEYHDLLFQNADSLSGPKLIDMAVSLNINGEDFKACLGSGKYRQVIEEDIAEGRRLGITSTPTVFVNKERFSGTPTAEDLQRVIDEALEPRSESKGSAQEER